MTEDHTEARAPQTWVSSTGLLAVSWTDDAMCWLRSFPAVDQAVTRGMSPGRAAEFTAGRFCARTAIRALGGGYEDLERLPNGSVAWPRGWTGSITHSQGVVIACVARTTLLRGIGVDIEPNLPLPEASAMALARDCFIGPAARLQADGSRLGFSAREAVFKALSAIGSAVPILAMEVMVWMETPRAGRFLVALPGNPREEVRGRWWLLSDMLLTIAAIAPEPMAIRRWGGASGPICRRN